MGPKLPADVAAFWIMTMNRKNTYLQPADRALRAVALLTCLSVLACVSGCGQFYQLFIDPLVPAKKVPAEHDMADKIVLVWVDDAYAGAPNHLLRRAVRQQIDDALVENEAVAGVVGYAQINSLRQRYPDTTELTIQQLGRKLHADQVLYVLINEFGLHHDAAGGFYRPHVSGAAKVVDVETGEHLWPEAVTYRSFSFTGELAQAQDTTFEDKLVDQLADYIAQTLAPCFYKHAVRRNPPDPV